MYSPGPLSEKRAEKIKKIHIEQAGVNESD
jgi:hypothetical protein